MVKMIKWKSELVTKRSSKILIQASWTPTNLWCKCNQCPVPRSVGLWVDLAPQYTKSTIWTWLALLRKSIHWWSAMDLRVNSRRQWWRRPSTIQTSHRVWARWVTWQRRMVTRAKSICCLPSRLCQTINSRSLTPIISTKGQGRTTKLEGWSIRAIWVITILVNLDTIIRWIIGIFCQKAKISCSECKLTKMISWTMMRCSTIVRRLHRRFSLQTQVWANK